MATKIRHSPSRAENALLTITEWEAKGREALVLECDYLELEVTGDANALAQRLFDKYHPAVVEAPVEEDLLLSSDHGNDTDHSDSPPRRRK